MSIMIEKLIKEFFSMRMMALGLLIFLVAIAKATFIESDFGTPASKIAIYNTRWFESLLVYLSISLIVNIVRYKMAQREKIAMLTFHLSFLVIILGAGLTRYVGFEGVMPIKQGQTSNLMYSSDPYLILRANDNKNMFEYEEQRWLSEGRENPFDFKFQLPNQPEIKVSYVSYLENFLDTIVMADSVEGRALEYVIAGETNYLFEGESMPAGDAIVVFGEENVDADLVIWEDQGRLFMRSRVEVERVDMMKLTKEDRQRNTLDEDAVEQLVADTVLPFYTGRLYMVGGESIMFREFRRSIAKTRIKAKQRDEGTHYLTVKLSAEGEEDKLVELPANPDRIIDPAYVAYAGHNFEIAYGGKTIELPFALACRAFELEHYAGSDMPSSFASEVSVIDDENQVRFDERIFMNNVMDYNGYRFFQSSYYPDQSGTILSVNYDWWGTNITYLGYLLMSIGMLLSIVAPNGRLRGLNDMIRKSRSNQLKQLKVLPFLLLLSFSLSAHGDHEHIHSDTFVDLKGVDVNEQEQRKKFDDMFANFSFMTVEQAKVLEDLLVQDYDGRIVPFHTLSDKIMRKVHYSTSYQGYNPVQVVMSFHVDGWKYWKDKPIVFVSAKIREQLGLDKHASMTELEDEHGQFKWIEDYNNAFEKPDSKKSEYDKQLIKLGERYRVMTEVFVFQHFRVVPIPNDPNGTWVWPFSIDLPSQDFKANQLAGQLLANIFGMTRGEVVLSEVVTIASDLKEIQWLNVEQFNKIRPSAELPSRSQINAEISYNKLKPFDRIKNSYFLVGFIVLIIFFIRTISTPSLKKEAVFKKIALPFILVIALFFILHGLGLGYRWYISGHAPWSNGYEAVVFIAWITVLAGFIFGRKNPAVIPATAILAGMMLMVTELNLLDPEITPLQPVLKSYWLMIHVAIITSSYGFLGLSAVLAIVNMILYLVRNTENKKRISMNVNELTAVSEITMTIGLFLLTIGTFLGGVWANESWGRYWGWDPKETWALVSVLTYAIILHLRFIPKLNDKFVFNTVSLWGYSAILFTFFGVNFKLVGLHSYAQGDGVAETPLWVYYTIFAFALFTIASLVKYLTMKSSKK